MWRCAVNFELISVSFIFVFRVCALTDQIKYTFVYHNVVNIRVFFNQFSGNCLVFSWLRLKIFSVKKDKLFIGFRHLHKNKRLKVDFWCISNFRQAEVASLLQESENVFKRMQINVEVLNNLVHLSNGRWPWVQKSTLLSLKEFISAWITLRHKVHPRADCFLIKLGYFGQDCTLTFLQAQSTKFIILDIFVFS